MTNIENHSLQILVVDDDPMVRRVHSKMLTIAGHQVAQAENGETALSLVKEQTFDAILMDINMPIMNGLDATINIRVHEQENNTPPTYIIGITGIDESEHENCLAKGMNIVLSKPISPAKLTQALEKIVNH